MPRNVARISFGSLAMDQFEPIGLDKEQIDNNLDALRNNARSAKQAWLREAENSEKLDLIKAKVRDYEEERTQSAKRAEEFQHTRLERPTQQIRLLEINCRSEFIECTIRAVNVSESAVYTAVSYTWGSPIRPRLQILLNGKRFFVRENLWKFLYALTEKCGNIDNEYWIDALCIDQLYTKERNQQASIMGSI